MFLGMFAAPLNSLDSQRMQILLVIKLHVGCYGILSHVNRHLATTSGDNTGLLYLSRDMDLLQNVMATFLANNIPFNQLLL